MVERDDTFRIRVTLDDGTVVRLPDVSGPWVEAAMRTALILFAKEMERRGIDQGAVESVSVTAAFLPEP